MFVPPDFTETWLFKVLLIAPIVAMLGVSAWMLVALCRWMYQLLF